MILDIYQKDSTRRNFGHFCINVVLMSQEEPNSIEDDLTKEYWYMVMQEELNQFKRNDV